MSNSLWCTLFPHANITHLTSLSSDHMPILLDTCLKVSCGPRPFRFEAMWLNDDSCFDVVHNAWNLTVSGSLSFQICYKIKFVKKALTEWNNSHLGNLHTKTKLITDEIYSLQQKFQSPSLLDQEKNLHFQLDHWLKNSELFWKQKSREKWLSDGDANSKFFHRSTIIQSRANRIVYVKNPLNELVFDWDSIGSCFLNFYKNLFNSDHDSSSPPYPHDLDHLFHPCISEDVNSNICSIPTPTEIMKILFSFASLKNPGPDGLPPLFYKSFWKTTRKALILAVQHFFRFGFLLKSLNHTFIALIPKSTKASQVDQFRPISLCNVTYKIISKIIANRLKPLLPSFISPFQMAFVPGRNIHDNNIISHEIMDYLHKKKGKNGFMAIKVDLAKAFDKVEWSLLAKILTNLGFCREFVDWILQCITTSSFSFLVNSAPYGMLKPSRGIRQGDPLSHFLFVIYTEILSRMLAYQENIGSFKGVKISRTAHVISHLLYADDLIIFCRSTDEDALSIKNILDTFSLWSSQSPNTNKSSIHFSSNTSSPQRLAILNIFDFKECNHKEKHLGFHFCRTPSKKVVFNDLIDKINTNLSGWKNLSYLLLLLPTLCVPL